MTVKNDHTEGKIVAVEEALSRTEHFIEKNQKIISIVIGIIVIIILGYFGFKKLYLAPKEKEAQAQLFVAEQYFESDSIDLAINGDGNALGLVDIVKEYKMTKSANLAHYYLGICYLKKGEFDNAISELKKFSSDDIMVAPLAIGAMGDAYMELNNPEKAATYYEEAADKNKNLFTTPQFLVKAGWAYEEAKQYDKAIKAYERVQKEYAKSIENRDIEKFIARAQEMLSK